MSFRNLITCYWVIEAAKVLACVLVELLKASSD
jgi:hypothetical protein